MIHFDDIKLFCFSNDCHAVAVRFCWFWHCTAVRQPLKEVKGRAFDLRFELEQTRWLAALIASFQQYAPWRRFCHLTFWIFGSWRRSWKIRKKNFVEEFAICQVAVSNYSSWYFIILICSVSVNSIHHFRVAAYSSLKNYSSFWSNERFNSNKWI